MEPIISPWIIYAIDLLNKVCVISIIALTVLTTVSIVAGIAYMSDEDERSYQFLCKAKWAFALFVTILIVAPDRETTLTMLAAQYITPDNIQAIQGNIVDFVGQIAEAVKERK